MGRQPYSDRWTTEDSRAISIKFLKNHGHLNQEPMISSGSIQWSSRGLSKGSVGFTVDTYTPDDPHIHFCYNQTDKNTGVEESLDYKVQLTWTPCNYGGKRWWFICPLSRNGVHCQKRVGVLYLAYGAYFGCRHCYNLTYTSCQESHKFDALFRKLGITEKQAMELMEKGEFPFF